MACSYEQTLADLRDAVPGRSPEEAVQVAMQTLQDHHPHYQWVGIYVLRGDVLELGPFVGKPTDHVRIPVGRGVCGTAVSERTNQVIQDVRAVENYLACSDTVRSEIVVLLWHEGQIVGQIDSDCDDPGAFSLEDETFLRGVAEILAPLVAQL